jgi:hypothetical protein
VRGELVGQRIDLGSRAWFDPPTKVVEQREPAPERVGDESVLRRVERLLGADGVQAEWQRVDRRPRWRLPPGSSRA